VQVIAAGRRLERLTKLKADVEAGVAGSAVYVNFSSNFCFSTFSKKAHWRKTHRAHFQPQNFTRTKP
jgi:hypothetical protein